MSFDDRSLARLKGVHPALVRVAQAALISSKIPFVITEGLRFNERQAYLFSSGKSRTLQSRHLSGRAVDVAAVVDGRISWDFEDYVIISKAWKREAALLGVPIIWGGDWEKFRDGPHFELVKDYP